MLLLQKLEKLYYFKISRDFLAIHHVVFSICLLVLTMIYDDVDCLHYYLMMWFFAQNIPRVLFYVVTSSLWC